MGEVEEKYWKKVEKYLPFLQMVPFVKMVAVCNNLSFGKVDEKSDIDVFVVAKTGRLFFVRTIITFLLQVLGVRRHGNKVAGRFCLSFFVDEEGANLSEIALEKDVYLAFWIKSLVPVIENGFSGEFMKKNIWIKDYFEVDEKFELRSDKIFAESYFKKVSGKILEFLFGGKLGNFVEKKLRNWQLKRARSKAEVADVKADLVLGEHILKFHNNDRRREYRAVWIKKFGNNKIAAEKFKEIIV